MNTPGLSRWGHLKINEDDLVEAMGSSFDMIEHYLDLKTGEIVIRQDDLRDSEGEDESSLPEWQREQLALNRLIEENRDERFVWIDPVESPEAYRWVKDFVGTVGNATLREELAGVIGGAKPFRRFKDMLHDDPEEQNRWFQFENARRREYAQEWLDSLGISYELVKVNPGAEAR